MINDSLVDGTDESLITSVKDGSQQAFGRLYDRYSPALLGVISRITGIGKIAEDTLQLVFLEIWNRKAGFDDSKERLLTWMIKIAVQLAVTKAKANPACDVGQTQNIQELVYGNRLAKI